MEIKIRPATAEDASGIASVKSATWEDEPAVDAAYIAAVIQQADHQTCVAVYQGTVVGFVDGFMTRSSTGISRWEVDLLAVYPDFRGQGIASRLVTANTIAGQGRGMKIARALIHVDNVASQCTFKHCGFQLDSDICNLYISSDAVEGGAKPSTGLHVIPVEVVNYRGLWLEGELTGEFSLDDFVFGQIERTRLNLDLVGAVIPQKAEETILTCVDAGYSLVGHYQWWIKNFTSK